VTKDRLAVSFFFTGEENMAVLLQILDDPSTMIGPKLCFQGTGLNLPAISPFFTFSLSSLMTDCVRHHSIAGGDARGKGNKEICCSVGSDLAEVWPEKHPMFKTLIVEDPNRISEREFSAVELWRIVFPGEGGFTLFESDSDVSGLFSKD